MSYLGRGTDGLFGLRSKKNRQNQKARENVAVTKKLVSTKTDSNFAVTLSNYQHIGARQNQEDAFALSDLSNKNLVAESGVLALVADGMGGLALGEDASRVAVQVFMREYFRKETSIPIPQRLEEALIASNTAVYDAALKDGEEHELGTTIVAVLIHERKLYWLSVGDSRIYHLRNNHINLLTSDHTYQNQLLKDVENGLISLDEAYNHPEGAYLTSFLGLPVLPDVDRNDKPLFLEPGDQVLLCSDGLYNTLSEEEIRKALLGSSGGSAENLIKEALSRKMQYQDNITVVLLTCKMAGNIMKRDDVNEKKE